MHRKGQGQRCAEFPAVGRRLQGWDPAMHSEEGLWLRFLGAAVLRLLTHPPKKTRSPGSTLPHLFSQHACEVGRGRVCPHVTEEEVEAHRGQSDLPKVMDGGQAGEGPQNGAWAHQGEPPHAAVARLVLSCPSCAALAAGPGSGLACPTLPSDPGLGSSGLVTLQVWERRAGERRIRVEKQNRTERSEAGAGWETKRKGLLTHKVYIFTHTCTHT